MRIDLIEFTKLIKDAEIKTSKVEINSIVSYIEKKEYKQIVYKYPGKEYISVILKYFEIEEDYKRCAEILEIVKSYNKLFGKNVKTTT